MGAKRKLATDDAADWPEFAEWLKLAMALDKDDDRSNDEIEHAIGRIYELEDLMEARAFNAHWRLSDRQLAMLAAVHIWHERARNQPFDMRTTEFNGENHTTLMVALAHRASESLPEVPFKFGKER